MGAARAVRPQRGRTRVARELGAPEPPGPTRELAARRTRVARARADRLTYREPVHVVRARGRVAVRRRRHPLLDAYNNVPVVGHCHPRVTEAVVRQTRRSTRTARYLYEPLVELAERLVATMPPGSGLDTCMLVNSGSEANDLAWRIATRAPVTRGGIVTDLRLPRRHDRDRRPLAGGVAGGLPPGARRDDRPPRRGREDEMRRRERLAGRGLEPRGDLPRRRLHERRHLAPVDAAVHARSFARRATRRRAVRGRRGAGGPRPQRRASVGVRAVRPRSRTSSRSASRWATAIRSPRCHAAGARRPRSRRRRTSSAPSAAIRSPPRRRWPSST